MSTYSASRPAHGQRYGATPMIADHEHRTEHRHDERGEWHRLRHAVTPHSHDTADTVDQAMETSQAGIRALWISLAVLGATAVMQAGVVVFSRSVALLGDTLHNLADASTAVPLGIAFVLGRRAAT